MSTGRIGSIGKLYWFMPPSANLALRELGIVLFSGGRWAEIRRRFCRYADAGRISWIGCGIFHHRYSADYRRFCWRGFLPKMNYLTLCGMLASSMTDHQRTAFTSNLHATSGAAALSYATVYRCSCVLSRATTGGDF